MAWVDYNTDGVHAGNFDDFMEALEGFRERKGIVPATRWLIKLNPEVERHYQMEMCSLGDGYTASMAKAVIVGENSPQPLPRRCECGDIMWYRATVGAMKCQGCEEVSLEKEYMDD